ncbi:MAG: hypothetical protein PUD55_02275 [Firmicutes bacterium]|nr:hypothetical protein [Bacillota bacterium]
MKKRLFSIVLSLCMVLALVPQAAFAEGEPANPYTYKEGTAGAGDNEGPAMLIDGKNGTKWCVTNFSSAYIIFETSSAVNVSGYSITTGGDNKSYPGRNPKNWKLYGCNDYTESGTGTWKEIHSVTDDTVLQDKNYTTYSFVFDRTETAYQYYKLEITAIQSGDVMQMSEFALTDCSHSWTLETVGPTCKDQGYTATICTICNSIKEKADYTPVIDHNYSGTDGACIYCGYKASDFDHIFDISQGTVIIKDDENAPGKIKVSFGNAQSKNSIDPSQIITVIGSTTNNNELKVETATPVTIRVKDLSIDSSRTSYKSAMVLIGGGTSEQKSADVTLILEGENTFIGGFGRPGIEVGPGKKLTIEGSGTVNAKGGDNAAGIGGGDGGSGGNITINGGTVNAEGGNSAAGIGGGYKGSGGNITINGGTVNAKGGPMSVAEIGYGREGSGGNITINGGKVNALDKGIKGSFSTGENGNAIVFASSISDNDDENKALWSGVIFEGNRGKVYGKSVTPTDDFIIENGKTLTIDNDKSLIIPDGVTLVNVGTIENSGKIYVDGTFTGTADNLYYPLTLVNATASGDTSEYNSKNYAKAGSTITLTPGTPPTGYVFDQWEVSPTAVIIENNAFTMPNAALKITAQWTECTHPGGLTHTPEVPSTYTEYGVKEYWTCSTCNMIFSDAEGTNEITDLERWKADAGRIDKLSPEIIEGMGQRITAGEKKTLSFTSNADYKEFLGVELDDKTLDAKNYTVKEGSTIVTLDADYVSTLPAGEHTIGIVSESGTAETTFTVEEKVTPGPSVETGDDTNLALWIALMLLAGAGITGTTVYARRKRTNE